MCWQRSQPGPRLRGEREDVKHKLYCAKQQERGAKELTVEGLQERRVCYQRPICVRVRGLGRGRMREKKHAVPISLAGSPEPLARSSPACSSMQLSTSVAARTHVRVVLRHCASLDFSTGVGWLLRGGGRPQLLSIISLSDVGEGSCVSRASPTFGSARRAYPLRFGLPTAPRRTLCLPMCVTYPLFLRLVWGKCSEGTHLLIVSELAKRTMIC